MTPQQIKGSFLPVKFTKENTPHLHRVCLSAILPCFCVMVQLPLLLAKKESQSAARRRWRECEELVTSKWPITNWNKKATIFKLDLPRLRNVWWVVRSSRISCFLSTSIRRLFLIYLWRLSGNLSLLSFLPVQKTYEIIPVSGGKFALVAGTVTLPFDLGQTVCPTLDLFLRSFLLH